MRNQMDIIVYGNATRSDMDFLMDTSFPSSSTSTNSETASDAQSAPPDLDQLFANLCNEYTSLYRLRAFSQLLLANSLFVLTAHLKLLLSKSLGIFR
ncbi:hypothetical protein HN51_055049 [Arachis hypogaea]